MLGRELSEALGLKFSLIEEFIELFKHQHFIEAKKSLGMGNSTVAVRADGDRPRPARECMESNQYTGPRPFRCINTQMVRRQRRADGWLTPEALQQAYRRMVVTPRILAQIGPAVSSGNSFLIYGQPGNGKTFLAEALMNVDDSCVYVPYALDCQGTIVQVFDPLYHQPVAGRRRAVGVATGPQHDRRWIKCRRPFIVTGGELTLEMLDLNYNATSKIYDAPYQLKANNGIYLIDDFGRQQCTPAEVLNRWIVPMERRVDYLKFHSGGKITVPFEAFLIFSTNLKPEQLGDEAFLRRIQYKMLLRSPDEARVRRPSSGGSANRRSLTLRRGLDRALYRQALSQGAGKPFRRCHPRDVLSHAIDLIHFEKLPFQLTDDLLDRAFESCFLEETES